MENNVIKNLNKINNNNILNNNSINNNNNIVNDNNIIENDNNNIRNNNNIIENDDNKKTKNKKSKLTKEELSNIHKLGQYFTKNEILQKKIISFIKNKPDLILEPSCGRGDLIDSVLKNKKIINPNIDNINFDIYEIDKEIKLLPDIDKDKVIYGDFLKLDISQTYKTILGNPPFVKTKSGNLFIDFIEKCYKLLQNKGELIFIVPSNFFKLTSAINLLNEMLKEGHFTHIFYPKKENMFEHASIDVMIFRYCKSLKDNVTIFNDKKKYLQNINGIITFTDSKEIDNNMVLCSELFDVYVGLVTGRDNIYRNKDIGNIEMLVSENKKEKYIYLDEFPNEKKPKINKYLLKHKDELINRKIRKFNEDNWFEWGAPRNKKVMETDTNTKCIYISNLTRKEKVAFIDNVQYFGGGLLMLCPKNKSIDLEPIVNYINSIEFRKSYIYAGRFKIGQRQLGNTYLKYIKSKKNNLDLEYSKLSVDLTKKIDLKEKKENGIYFTPYSTIKKNIEFLKPFMNNIKNILEPSCGSCEYIIQLNKEYCNKNIIGIEYNKTIYNSIKYLEKKNNIKIYNESYITYNNSIKPDLIIGNPPYYVMKKDEVDINYNNYFTGRPNIFILFIIKSLNILNDNGILSFVLPTNFLNCLYYNKTRKFIYNNFKILTIIECNDNYIETNQETIILIVQKISKNIIKNTRSTKNKSSTKNNLLIKNKNNTETSLAKHNKKYVFINNEYYIFMIPEKKEKIIELYKNSVRLRDINLTVSVGNVVWNQCKDILTNDKNKTLLIYSSDIKNNKLCIQRYSNNSKKNYINKEGLKEPILLLNRGYGKGEYKFEYCLIHGNREYLVENHLICIKSKVKKDNKLMIKLYNKIINSFNNSKTKEFIKLYFGNNAINTTELCEILPIYGFN